jgi:hypothetical protein
LYSDFLEKKNYTTSSPTSGAKLSFLNNLVSVFETEADNVSSGISEKVWEWELLENLPG